MSGIELCEYRPDRGIDYYASGLAGILKVVVGAGKESTHVYVKEVRKALETLVFSVWDRSDEYIPIIAESSIPVSIRSGKVRECFRELLIGLLTRFRETTDDFPVGNRIRLMNITISAIAEMARWGKVPPIGNEIITYVFSSKSSQSESQSQVSKGGESI